MFFSFSLFTIIDSKCLFVSKGNIMFQIQLEVAPENANSKVKHKVLLLLDIGKIKRNLISQNKAQLHYVSLLFCS